MFYRGTRRKDPSRLRFGPRELGPANRKNKKELEVISNQHSNPVPSSEFVTAKPVGRNQSGAYARPLNVFFMYNGESFDAYEILGVPAGCSVVTAREHYTRTFAQRSENERRLYDAAILALEKIKPPATSA